jgi:hypothetical protein
LGGAVPGHMPGKDVLRVTDRAGGGSVPGARAGCRFRAEVRGACGVRQNFGDSGSQGSWIAHFDQRARGAEIGRDFGEVFHMRTRYDGPRGHGRLQDVVTAARGQRATHEHHVRQREQAGELADGIEQQGTGQRQILGAGQAGTADERDPGARQRLRGCIEALRLAGGQQQEQSRPAGGDLLEGRYDGGVFIGIAGSGGRHGAGGDPDGARLKAFEEAADRRFRRGLAHFEIVFEIAGGERVIRRCADANPALPHVFALRQQQIDLREHAAEEPAQRAIAAEGAVGDAAVDQQQARAGALGLAKQVGPDLGFHNDDQRRPQRPQHAPHGEDVIERGVEDARRVAQLLVGGMVSGQGGDGDEDRRARQAEAQLPDQFHRRNGFADGNGVQPNRAGDGLSKGGGQVSAALPQGAEVGGPAQAAPQEVDQNNRQAERLKEAVE